MRSIGLSRYTRRAFLKTAGAGLLAASGLGQAASPGHAAPPPVTIGATVALTGPFSAPGTWFERVWRWYWEQYVPGQGGLLGRPVRLILYDDQSDPSRAGGLYQRLISVDRVDLLLGPYPTPTEAVVIPITEGYKRVLINAGTVATNLLVGHGNHYTFTAYTEMDVEYTRPWFEWMDSLGSKRPQRLALLTLRNPFTLGVRKGAQDFAAKRGMAIAADEIYDPSTTDFAPLVRRAREAGAGALGLLSYFPDSVSITRAMRDLNYNPGTTFNVISSNLPEWTTDLGRTGEYAMSFTQCWHTMRTPENAALWAMLQSKYHVARMPFHAGVAMNAAQMLRQGVEGAHTIENQDAIAEYLRTHAIQLVSGSTRFNADGLPGYFGLLTQVLNGNAEVVWPLAYKTAKPVYPMPSWA